MAAITRIDYTSLDGLRSAVVRRVENDHVPPLGVTWYCIPSSTHGVGPSDEYTSRAAAEKAAREWCNALPDVPR